MRIIVTSSYWPRPNQVHKAMFEVDQVRALAQLGHEVDVIVQTELWRGRAAFMDHSTLDLDPVRVRIHQIIVPRLPEPLSRRHTGAIVNLYAAGLRMRAWLALHEAVHGMVEAVIVHGERSIGLSAGLWNSGYKRPVVMIVHGSDPVLETLPEAELRRHMGANANSGINRVILVGNRLRPYAERLGYDPARILVIPNGFRTAPAPPAPLRGAETPVRLVTAARLVAVKGIDDALRALALVSTDHPALDWRFDILGDGSESVALKELSARLGLQDRVQFHGALPHDEVLRVMENSAIFLLPSWNEAFGLAYLEAMAMGTAVVGCHGNGAADILTNGVDGCLVPPRDVYALAATLTQLIGNPQERDVLASAAMDSVLRFTWSKNAAAVLEALDA